MEDLRSYQYESAIRSAETHVKHGENVTNKKQKYTSELDATSKKGKEPNTLHGSTEKNKNWNETGRVEPRHKSRLNKKS